jgi:hypothetical protein
VYCKKRRTSKSPSFFVLSINSYNSKEKTGCDQVKSAKKRSLRCLKRDSSGFLTASKKECWFLRFGKANIFRLKVVPLEKNPNFQAET